MDKSVRVRWGILLSALFSTVAAVFYPTVDSATAEVSDPAPRAAKRLESPPALTAATTVNDDEPEENADPFAPRNWQAPPAPAPIAQSTPIAVAAVDLIPPGPPELPFRFVGSMSDNAEQIVYLSRGDTAIVARTGDVLDSSYKVTAITASQIEFEYLPSGAKQSLVFPTRDN
ncbi:hypothetical protein GTP55_13550 [Duganella sp. FT109W]|uniref:Secretion system X translation initiation factor n=1 Tax=Duganella margarita TaxID=2692170 RepID=A0ABW9WJ99_9BURK|nr:hypothetical protein [Duganella margarita]MYN40399.1 hypothetical protein [Duganella margarita]